MADTRPFFERLTDAIAGAMESALQGRNPNLPKLKPANAAGMTPRLAELRASGKAVDAASTPNAWIATVGHLHDTLGALGTDAFGPGGDAAAVTVRALQE